MSVEPFEFIDFSKFEFKPTNVSRHQVDPLAIDIKLEPEDIKQEPVDSLYVDAEGDVSCCTQPVDNPFQNEGNVKVVTVAEALVHNVTVNQEHPAADVVHRVQTPFIGISAGDEDNNMVGNALTSDWFFNSTHRQSLSDNFMGIVDFSNGTLPVELVENSMVNLGTTVSQDHTQLQTSTSEDPCKKNNRKGRCRLSCYHCGYTSNQKCHMRYHMIAIHIRSKPYSCRKCNIKFVQQGGLKRHIASVHLRQKPFECDKCSFTCGRKEGLKRHNASVHDHLRPYSCSECPYRAVRKYRLDKHVKTVHRKERPFRCELCSYASSKKVHLVNHTFHKHHGVKRFSCQECPFKASQKSNLKQHVDAVHRKLKPFICHHCDHRTNHKNSLRGHISSFHSRKIKLACHHCRFATRKKAVLRKHVRKHLR